MNIFINESRIKNIFAIFGIELQMDAGTLYVYQIPKYTIIVGHEKYKKEFLHSTCTYRACYASTQVMVAVLFYIIRVHVIWIIFQ